MKEAEFLNFMQQVGWKRQSWQYDEWRWGQTLMNVLADLYFPLYDIIAHTPADCFYDDSKVGAFFEALGYPLEQLGEAVRTASAR